MKPTDGEKMVVKRHRWSKTSGSCVYLISHLCLLTRRWTVSPPLCSDCVCVCVCVCVREAECVTCCSAADCVTPVCVCVCDSGVLAVTASYGRLL